MSSETLPISPTRFAEALKELPASTLALKVLELRNSIAHLDYSNAELKPFAEGTKSTLDQQQQGDATEVGQPDPDCQEAIAENEAVIARMQERISLIRAEVEGRGLNWQEFQGTAATTDGPAEEGVNGEVKTNGTSETATVNGHSQSAAESQQHEAWRDGTFQTGTIRSDDELLRELLNRVPPENEEQEQEDPDGGMHL
ncbi:hypothetical protein NPX13_g3905 [Xylaria arbuscula]|uniref:Secondary alcohol dehydrogenase n=1 Tax=Xylaria arbuscula TaxID=114810 RepID=A0A9W8NHK6_9PEZI|nr:hypothetical protein NPX13_g3905 [Xylaria arbuscula]